METRITFGQRFRTDIHRRLPLAHPDGWVTIVGVDSVDNRQTAIDQLGIEWSNQYDEPFEESDSFYWPRGELARFEGGQWVATHHDE